MAHPVDRGDGSEDVVGIGRRDGGGVDRKGNLEEIDAVAEADEALRKLAAAVAGWSRWSRRRRRRRRATSSSEHRFRRRRYTSQ
ncbi:MAG TPA: hypothetical protein VND88_07090 [Candidatus Acidoferrales bacterium]|nr:hypothetical protein [Candidatus Acidoferrales bacterium]